jgi:hypothetical protein
MYAISRRINFGFFSTETIVAESVVVIKRLLQSNVRCEQLVKISSFLNMI